ncbi:MAG TPA: efflux RND transporter permease subunit [Gemmatimonadales bacterium]|nr:efflux RND transporter permease subunit [Gemmatimonadales bacterium]
MISWATTRPAVIWAICLSLILSGAVAFARLPLAARTTVELPTLQVATSWNGAAAELVETYLTSPIEAAIQSVRGVRRTSSTSTDGQSQITVELDPGANVQLTRLAILERIEVLRPDFPAGSGSPAVSNYVPDDLDESPLLTYSISGPYTAGALSKLVRETITPRVSAVQGVAGVNSFGSTEIGVAVAYDAARLRQLDILPGALDDALRNSRVVSALGDEQRGATERRIALRDQPAALEDLARLPITGAGGRIYQLGDLVTIRPDEDSRGMFFRIDGEPAVSLSISRLPGADAIKTARNVRTVLDDLAKSLPPGVRLVVRSDETEDLKKELNDLILRGLIAFASVMLVLAVTLRNAKSVGLVMGSAAVAIAGTALGLYLLNIPANLLTLAGLGMGIGILVQDGLIVTLRLQTQPDTPAGRAEAGKRIAPAVVGSTLTTAVVLFPFLYLQGNARAAFIPFAAAFTLALGWSVVSSLVMVPALGAGHGMHESGWPRTRRAYRRVVGVLTRRRWITLAVSAVVLAWLGWGFVKKVPRSAGFGSFFGQRTTLSVNLGFPRGSDPEALDRGMRDFESIVVGVPGVDRVITRGTGDGAFMQVVFEREAGLSGLPYQLQEELTQRALLIGGATVGVQGKGPGFYAGGGGGGAVSYRIKLLGYSFDGVEQLALDLKRRLERIPRVKSVDINAGSFFRAERAYTVTLEPDRAALARYGLTATDFARAITREVRGPVGSQPIEINGEETNVTLKAAGARDRSLDELRSALVPNPAGAPVRIGDLARVDEREALSNINREDQQYVRIVSYDFRGPQKLAERTHKAFMASISVPAGYSVGDDEFSWADDASSKGLWLVFAIGVVLVVLAVAMVFDSVWAAAIVFASLPFALAGVVAAFWVAKAAFTREAAVGVILVVGLAVHQAILLVDAALNRRRAARERGERGLTAAAAADAAEERSGMIVLVTLTTLASLLPLALGTDSDSLFGAIALATTGGTIFGTLGAMLVVPAMVVGRGERKAKA